MASSSSSRLSTLIPTCKPPFSKKVVISALSVSGFTLPEKVRLNPPVAVFSRGSFDTLFISDVIPFLSAP